MGEVKRPDDYDKEKLTEEGQKWEEAKSDYFLREVLVRVIPPAIGFALAIAVGWALTKDMHKNMDAPSQDQKGYEDSNSEYEDNGMKMQNGTELEFENIGKSR